MLILSSFVLTIPAYATFTAPASGTIADKTGTLDTSPTSLYGGANSVGVTAEGTFDVTLPVGVTGTAVTDGWTVTGSPKALASGTTTTITVQAGGSGNITINLTIIGLNDGTYATSARVFVNVFETGDMYFICVGHISYLTTPSTPSTTAYQFNLYDLLGNLVKTVPVQQYDWDVYGIYLSADEVNQADLTINQAYTLRLTGSPLLFTTLTEGVNMKTVTLNTTTSWIIYDSRYRGTNLDVLYLYLYNCARDIQIGNSYAPPIFASGALFINGTGVATGSPILLVQGAQDVVITTLGTFNISLPKGAIGEARTKTATVIASPVDLSAGDNAIETSNTGKIYVTINSSTNTLTADGATIFSAALPKILLAAPNLYNSSVSTMTSTRQPYTQSYQQQLTKEVQLGSQISTAFNNFGAFIGVSGQMAEAMWGLFLCLMVAAIVFMYTSNTTAGLIATIPMVIICVWVGAFPMAFIFLLAAIIVAYMAYFLFLRGI